MKFNLTVLGIASAIPVFGRHLTAQVLSLESASYLIDCGEGTQMQMMRYNVKMHKLNAIFISHLHGDHFYGLAGLLTTLNMQGRTKKMHLYGPPQLEKILVTQLIDLPQYELCFHTYNMNGFERIYEDAFVCVHTLPMLHRVPCTGFIFTEKMGLPNISKVKIKEHAIPFKAIEAIKAGSDFVDAGGLRIPHDALVLPQRNPRKYAFCSDTAYNEQLMPYLKSVDLLYHEATFLHEQLHLAQKTGHSTARQAAEIAAAAEVQKLIIGHFSARYKNLNPLLLEARECFESTLLAKEGQIYPI